MMLLIMILLAMSIPTTLLCAILLTSTSGVESKAAHVMFIAQEQNITKQLTHVLFEGSIFLKVEVTQSN